MLENSEMNFGEPRDKKEYFLKAQFGFREMELYLTIFVRKKEGKNQESIQSSTTPDPGYQLLTVR